ncbi:70 kDa peptidyl-prolyl isomerase [Bienertia sinuspersici]
MFFKKGEVDKALEKYGFGGLFLSCLTIKEEGDKFSFLRLASNILLNMAACLLKKEESLPAGHLCTVVLEFNLEDVKELVQQLS